MKGCTKISPLKFLVFLLPILLPVSLSLSVEWNPATHSWDTRLANSIFYAFAFLYPVISAIVFSSNKILVWSTPVVYVVLTVISAVLMGSLPNAFGMLAAIAWSLICTGTAVLIRRKTKSAR